jgi:methylamine dehydrogenase heavy chain
MYMEQQVKTLFAAVLLVFAANGYAALPMERMEVAILAATPEPHWVWVNDISFMNMVDGRAYLIDGDSGRVLGMISGGNFHDALQLPADHSAIYSTDTFYSRGTRGVRTDVLSIYDPKTLAPVGEVILPAKQLLSVPTPVGMEMTTDGRFLAQYNFTPAQSLSIVDLKARTLVGEVDTPGCAFVYPTGPRTINMLCGDGSVLTLQLGESGNVVTRSKSDPMFDSPNVLVNEDAVRVGSVWYFVSYKGEVYTMDGSTGKPSFGTWSLMNDADSEGWRPGGYQLFAIHAATGRMYVSMQKGGPGTHKNPGTEIWVYDIASKKRLQRVAVEHHLTSVQVSKDDQPLLYTVSFEKPALQVYDALTLKHLRTVGEIGTTPTIIQIP